MKFIRDILLTVLFLGILGVIFIAGGFIMIFN